MVLTFRDDTSLRSDCGCALPRRHKSQKCSDGFMHYGTVFVGACYGCLREDGISPVVQVRVSGASEGVSEGVRHSVPSNFLVSVFEGGR